ncbi:MAG: 30S ribosomal protein S12 methylthiotransferase RimO [Bacteroidales bacterium]|nr:30S ribosomal protein S12 methylthiotransferase RimO [Bacteroidales bacterium]
MKDPEKITFITLGCSKNTVDSEQAMAQFRLNRFAVDWEEYQNPAENVIINTCGFIGDAKEESVQTILHFVDLKSKGKIKKLFVVGCLVKRYKAELQTEIPEVDGFYGVNFLKQLIEDIGLQYFPAHLKTKTRSTPNHYSYLKIAEGCNRQCSFCAIPQIRGKHISKTIEDIIDEAKILVADGVKEIILISQDLVYYGKDNYGEFKLAELVDRLAQLDGLHWLRLHYLHPLFFDDKLLGIMEEHKNICRYIDIPVQHISDKMLQIMRRGITKEETIHLLDKIRKTLPDAVIRTTLLVGHPGEGQAEFDELKQFVSDFGFDRLGVFTYSHEENTPAYLLEDKISQKTKEKRRDELMEIQQEISLAKNQKIVGKSIEVLIDRVESDFYFGRTQFDSPEVDNEVLIPVEENLKIGDFYNIKITEAGEYDLTGEVVE